MSEYMVVEARPELVSKLVREAAALPAAERAAFLDRACAGDSKLRREVEARLAPPSPEGPTLTEAEPDAGAESTVTMDLSRHRIGPYLVTEQIGEGGMGVVYRAHDTQLDRSVAIKVLPPGVRADSERRWRFLNEAKAASALNHPNIVTIYTITQHQGMDCIVMEYLEGKPLSKLIPRKGLPVKEALRIGAEVADALAAAHAAGIVHRDLKPSNVMVSEKGRVKVLDFGLAKLRQRGVAADGEPHTEAGRVFGTVGYMSPEQAEGKEVDARSDIFSFGCVLYEMLSGHRPFKGTSTASVIAALLTTDPEPPAGVPDDLKHVLCRCFRKDPARRWQSIADVKIALEDVQTGLACAPAAPSRFRRLRRAAPVVLAAAALVAAAYTTWKHWALQGGKLEYSVAQVTEEPGQEQNPALSPDGRTLVYASQGSGNWDLYSLRVGGRNPINLTKDSPADDTQPAFSWDGERIAFRSEREGGGIFIMGATGESVRRLTDFGYLPAWSPDGKQIACSTAGPYRPDVREVISSQVFAVDVDTGQRRLLSGGVLDAVQPNWSPHGTRVAFWGMREGARDIFTVSREGGAVTMVTSDEALDWNPVWSPDGKYLYFSSNRGGAMNLWRVPIREETGKTRGDPEPVTVPATYAAGISFSRDGQRLAYMNCLRRTNLFRAGFDPARESVTGAPSALTKSLQEALYPSISRDGQWVAFTHQGLQEDLLAVKADGSAVRQITGDPAQDRMPRWSPDSRELAYMSTRSGRFEIWTVHADGSGLRQITEGSPRGGVSSPAWSPDGKRLSYNLPDEMGYIIEAGKPWREQQPQLAKAELPDRSWFWVSDWSHDGERLAGTIQRFDGSALGVAVYTIKTGRIEQVTGFGRLPRWLPDGRRLLFHANGRIFLVDTAGKRTREILSVPEGYISPYFDLSWDGRMIAFSLETLESDIWILSPNR